MVASETAGSAAETRPDGRRTLARRLRTSVVPAAGLGGVAFVAAQAAVGATNAGFHVVVSRLLGPADYGALGALLAMLTVITVPAATLESLLTGRVAVRLAEGQPLAAVRMLWRALAIGTLAMAGLLAVAAPVARWLALPTVAPMAWLAVYCVPMALSVAGWALVCGQRRFAMAGAVAVTGVLARLGFAVLFLAAGWGVAGAVAASVCSDTLRALLLVAVARIRRLDGPGARPVEIGYRQVAGSTAAFAALWLLTGADTVLARRLLSPVLAGQYAAAAMATRSALIITHAVCLVAIPVFASAGHRRAVDTLWRTIAVAAGCGGLITAGATALGPWLLPAVLGPGFAVPRPLLAMLGLVATALGVLWVLVQYQIARVGRAGTGAWAGLAVAVAGVTLTAAGPYTLAATMIGATVVALALAARTVLRGAASPAVAVRPASPYNSGQVDLTMVVPYHNPGPLLRPTLLRLMGTLRDCGLRYEIIAVSDGCTDGSPASIADLDDGTVRRLALPRNLGKGAALQLGLREGRGRYLGFIDADGDLDPADLHAFVTLMKLYDPDAVIGAKYHPLSKLEAGPRWQRRAYSMGYRGLIKLLFPTLPVTDTQVGIKVFRRQLLDDVLPHSVECGFVFDLEVLVIAHRMGYRRVLPAPVTLRRLGDSTIRPGTVWRMLVDTVDAGLAAAGPWPRPGRAVAAAAGRWPVTGTSPSYRCPRPPARRRSEACGSCSSTGATSGTRRPVAPRCICTRSPAAGPRPGTTSRCAARPRRGWPAPRPSTGSRWCAPAAVTACTGGPGGSTAGTAWAPSTW